MKFFTAFTILAITVAASISAAPSSNDATFSIVERDTPTCWLDDKIGGTCDFKCEQRGAKSGSCKTGTCVCSYSKRNELPTEEEHVQTKRDQDVQQFHKRWSCQIGEIGGKGLSNSLCSASCADASGGKKDGYCDKNDTCICKA